MAFDPSQPFDIVSEPEDQPQDKPAFDPSKPFEVIGEREEDVAGKLETLSKVATDKPDEAARISSLSKKTGAPYDLVKTAPDQFENHVNQPDWKGLSDGAPKTAKYLGEDPERFQQARDDTQALADMEKFRSELKARGIPELKNNYGTDANSVFAANNQTGDGAIENTANPDVNLENYARGLGIQFNQALKKAEIGLNMAAGDLAGLSGDDAEAVKRGQLRQLEGANNESNAATPTFDTKTAEFVYGGASSLVQTAPSLAAGILNPTLGLTIAGAQTAAPVYADTRARGGSAGESALNAIGQGAVEVITEKLPIGFASEAFGKMKVSDFFKQFAGREMLGEQAATLAQDGLDTAIANPDKTWEEYLAERPEAAIRTMFAVGVTSATMAGVQYAANKTMGFHAEKDVAANQHINDIKTELAILENSKLAQRSPETMHEYLDHIDGEEKQTVFVDPSQLFNQGGVARADLERIAPSAAAQIDEALDKGGLIEIPKNELLIGLMGKPDIQGNVVQFLKADANADSLHDINTQREGLSQEMYDLASKQIEKSKDATKLTTQRDEIIQHLQDSMSAAGMDDAGNKHRAAMIASGIVSQAIREKVDPVELYKQQVGNISNTELQGSVFNQQNPFTQENGFDTVEEIDFSLPEGFTSLDDGSNVKASTPESGDQNGQQKFEFDQFGDRKTDPNEKDIQLSNFPKGRGWRVYDKAKLLEGIRLASDKIRGELGRTGSSESQATRELTSGPLGPFSSSSVSSEIKGDRLFIYYVGQEQAELGLTDEAALTVILNKTGELVVNGPPADSATFEEFKKLGWADFAEMKDGEKSEFWTSLDGFEGLDGAKGLLNPGTAAMLADAHARLRAWRGEDKVLINWVRYTGATGNALNGRKGVAFFQNQAAPRGTFNPITREIGLTNAADLSTFLHESGHLFLEITADLAAREGASEAVKKDMDTAFQWFGITGESFDDRMAAWNKMTLDEKRPYHEKWAESFEQYLFEGKAPSMELRDAFRNFRQWLTHVYKSLSQFVGTHDGAKLNDEMRSVFDRMLATEQQIEEMEAARGMLPLFSKKPAGMTESEWTSYRQAADEATQSAVEQLTSRSLRDMKWLANAKNKAIRKLQREAADERRVARMEARQQVLSQPVYRAWQFLKAPIEGSKAANKKAKQSEGVDSKRDSLFAAIAKLGGLNREEMMAQMGYGAKDFAAWKSGIFSKPVVRKDGGLSLDAMSEALSQHNYLTVDEHGKVEIGDLLDKAMEEMRGNKQYSTDADYDVLLGDTQYAATPDAEQVDFVGGRLSRQAIREMYDDADLANMQGDENPIGKLQLEGYTQIGVSEDKGNERQYTLFGEDGDNSPADNKRKNAKKPSGNVEPAAQVPGRFATTVGNEKTKTINAGFEKLNTPDKVAFATSHISKNPQEALLVVVTDKNHKPISILRHSLGEKAAATVDQGIVAGWAVNVPNGAHVWLSHNHPSGKPKLSQADERVSNAVADLLNGTHLQHHGIMAVTHEGLFGWTDGSSRIESKEIPAPDNDVPVDVVEREFKTTGRLSDDYNDGITGFNDAVSAARDISGGDSGLMLLDAQYRPIGFVPVDFAKSLSIRATKLQSDILGAIELSNASGVISYTKDTSTNAEKGILNVGGLIESARVTPVDAIIDRGGSSVISWANMGARISSSTFQQPAYHGTPYKFDKFSLEHMGRGEGAQAYGWGLYFAGSKDVSEYYRKNLTGASGNPIKIDNSSLIPRTNERTLGEALDSIDREILIRKSNIQSAKENPDAFSDVDAYVKTLKAELAAYEKRRDEVNKKGGQLYKVDIPEDDTYLLWDRPLSEQSDAVKSAIQPAIDQAAKSFPNLRGNDGATGQGIYEALKSHRGGNAETASKFMHSLGISGIKYLDGTSRNQNHVQKEAAVRVAEKRIAKLTKEGKTDLVAEWEKKLEVAKKEIDALNYNYVIFDDNAVQILETYYQKGGDSSGKRSLESLGVMSDEGLHPDTVADLFGLSSGDELVRKLLTLPDPVSEIERLTDEIMLQRHSDLATPEGRERAAESAIHNEARAKFIATELAMLNRAIGKPRMIMAAAKEYAGQIVSALRVRDLKTGQYDAAEAKASKEADKALRDGNTAAAALAKRNQVLHNMTAKMVRDAQDEVEKAVRYLKKFDKPNKKIDIDYQEQIDTLLERYDLRQKTLKAIERSQNLAQWIEQQKAEGLEPVIPDYLQDEAKRANYKMLTVEELRGLVDAVKNIEHLGRLKNRLLTDKAKRELNALADGIGKSIADNGGDVKPSKLERNTAVDRLSDLASGFFSMHRKLASIVRQLDGWKDGGILWDAMIRPMNEAGDHEAVMHEKSTMALAEVFVSLKNKKLTKKLYIPMIATSLSYEGRLAVALNWGNEGNRQRLMDGDKWGIGEVNAILATLTAEDWKFVQGVWDHIATYKDEIGEQQRRLTGVEPSWVDATPFEIKTADGQTVQVQGGYYPAKYDTTRSTQALSNEAAGNVFDQWRAAKGQGKTRDGFTKSRATQVKDRPLRKDFGVITQHITEVTHRLAWQDWVVDMNRLIKKEQVDSSIRAHYGNEILEEIRKAIEDITTGDVTAQSSYEQAINHLRIGTTIVGLGWNLTTSLLQPFGLTQSMVRIGPKWVAKGLATWIGNPARMNARLEEVYSKSDFMRLRGKTMMREMNEILNTVRKEKLSKIEATYFYGIQKMQVIADMPTWLGQYEKSMAEFDGDESKAIALADQAVLDAQGGGQNKDLARIQRGGPLLKLWTNFYSYFNTTYNLTREVAGRTDVKDPASVAKSAVDMLLLYTIPSVMVSLLKGAIIGDDDEDELADRLWRDQLGYLFGSMVGLREISAAFSGFNGYSGPAGTRFFSEIARLGKQAEQGEADAPFLKSLNNVGGILFHYPAGQINRTIEGANALYNGETDSPAALIFGKPK